MITPVFQPIKQGDSVVGMMYRKQNNTWQSLCFAAVKSRWSIYRTRVADRYKNSEFAQWALELWTWAMQQFQEGRALLTAISEKEVVL